MKNRGMTLEGPCLDITFTSRQKNVIKVSISHYKGGLNNIPKFELCEDHSFAPEIVENDNSWQWDYSKYWLQVRSVESAFAFVKAGLGVSFLPDSLTSAKFLDVKLLDLESALVGSEIYDYGNPIFPQWWKKSANGNALVLEADKECSQVLVMYVKGNADSFAVLNLLSDGQKVGRFSGHSLFGWNNPWFDLVMSEDDKKMRLLSFETEKDDEKVVPIWCDFFVAQIHIVCLLYRYSQLIICAA